MLSKYAIELLLILNNKETCTLDYLVEKLNLSKHTLLNLLDEIESVFKQIKNANLYLIRKSGEGIKLIDKEHELNRLLIDLHKESNTSDTTTIQGRCKQLILRLINANDYLTLQDLADELYVSKGTVSNDLEIVKTILQTFYIALESKRNRGIRLSGNENDIRKLFSSTINDDLNDEASNLMVYDNLNSLYDVFDKDLVDEIREIIISKVGANLDTSNIQVSALLVHVIIAIQRIKDKITIQMPRENLEKVVKTSYYTTASELVDEIEKKINDRFTIDETCYIAMHLMCSKKVLNHFDLVSDEYQIIDDKLKNVIDAIVSIVSEYTLNDAYNDKELIDGLILHLKPTIERIYNNLTIKNPYLEDIKKNYLIAFEIAIKANEVLNEAYQIGFCEDEIAYIALHIQAHMERFKKTNIKNIAVVCITGVGTSQLVLSKLRNSFKKDFNFQTLGAADILNDAKFDDYDLVLSTVPLNINKKVLLINPIITDEQMAKIARILHTDTLDEKGTANHMGIFLLNNVHILKKASTKDEVISTICQQLLKSNSISKEFEASVLQREAIACTAYGMVALPHGNVDHVKESTISVLICKEGIEWESQRVKVVFLISLNADAKGSMNQIFDLLYMLVSNQALLTRLIESKQSEEVLSLIKEDL